MLLQESIIELNSGIINITNDKVHLTGFMSPERLLDYYNRGYDCRFSVGIYPKEVFDIAYTKNNALFLILLNGVEVTRHQFCVLKTGTVKFKDESKNAKSKVYTIRKCAITGLYNYKDMDKSILLDNEVELINYFMKEYKIELTL